MATIVWTDPQGTPTADGTINSRVPKLVNDLDIRINDGTTTSLPWVLDVLNPSVAATRGDNIRDNVEQVFIANATPGKTYTITVSHKGALQSGVQAYSLIVSGIGGANYCASAPTSTADSRINNLTLANINNTPAPGCTSYSDYTAQTAILEQGRTYPLSLTLGTCGVNFNKAAKVFIDWNSNGIFEATEEVATTAIINGTGIATANITVPGTVTPGNYSLMRVVLTETGDAATIQACGTYAKGETQDYRVQFTKSNTDAGIAAIVNPQITGVCSGEGLVTVTVKNFGGAPISNVLVTVTIKAADNTVTTITEIYTPALTPLQQDNFTLTTPFNFVPGATYTITATTNLASDAIIANNQFVQNIAVFVAPVPANLAALYCDNSKQYLLSGQGDGTLFWYKNSTDLIPLAYGSSVTTAIAPSNNTFYAGLNDFAGTVGPANKKVFGGGGYNQFTPGVDVYTAVPMVIQSARLYIGNAGVLTFNVTNASGQIVSSTTINATATRTTPAAGPQADDVNDQGRVYQLNLTLPAAGKYTITPVFDDKVTVYRNNGGVSGYPFKLGSIFSITGNGATPDPPATDTAFYKGYYYYFYDMHVKSAGCASAVKVAITLSKPLVTQVDKVLSSNFANGNQWYLDGKPITGATNPNYTAQQSGNYQVGVSSGAGCIALSDSYAYSLAGPRPTSENEIGLISFPVPANNDLNVAFVIPSVGTLTLSLVNPKGAVVYSKTQNAAKGNFSTVINVTGYAPGIYMVRVALGGKIYSKKVMVMR
ncbi:GEVED domain-containing protein [Mucilaginibacter antarcticus]|uniref:GEVED domain-containing protein n=1 Tax=Mucilaginibacter antarcticus TaxID=1855725 RepID=UPI003629B9B3